MAETASSPAPVSGFAPWENPKAEPLIRLQGVSKAYGDVLAVQPLDLGIYDREFFALLGPSGCGKTTIMRMLAGFEAPSSGRIFLGDQDITDMAPNQRPVNMMFQSYALFPHLSVWDNIAFGLRRDGMGREEMGERVAEMLRLTRLEKLARRKPDALSGGQRQRVALARSLARAPRVLLLDEPLGALDKKLRQQTQFELVDIQERTGTTFVVVTHDQEEAMTMATRIAVMDEGVICQIDTPGRIYEAPSSVYVAEFIGDINVFTGQAALREKAPEAPPREATTPATPAAAPAKASLVTRLLKPFKAPSPAQGPVALLSPPDPSTLSEPVPEGGIEVAWAEGQPPIIAANGEEALAGRAVSLALRPEKIGISKEKPNAPNVLKGKVVEIAYLGNVSTYHVRLGNGQMVKAQITNSRRLARRAITWEDEVWLSFSATASVVLEAEG